MRTILKRFGRAHALGERRLLIVLVLLLLGIAVVYGRIILMAGSTPVADIPPEVSAVLATKPGTPLVFPRLHPVSDVVWHKMTATQRHVLSQKRRWRYEVFFLAFAHATPKQQRAVIERTRLRFEMRFLAFAHATLKRRAAVVQQIQAMFPAPFRNEGNNLQRTIAVGLASGNPEMHAAMADFFMAMRNGR